MAKSRKSSDKSGRLVWNHSTHVPGLIKLLTRLTEEPGIKTITPGRLARVKGRPTPLTVRVTVPTQGGFKLQARCQGSVQEVFVVTDLSAEELEAAIKRVEAG